MITAHEIRQKFIEFFQKYEHQKISSSSLIPQNDPTLLFANAGMNQFKDNFTGKANPKNKRALSIQKCVRAGGKHNDLENVGMTSRHHTFFEMLGNFSFGDYFKEDAIKMAWSFLTEELKIPKEKLYITVHDSDEEARLIWHNQEGIALDRIFYMGDKDNFWEMGDTGPCGPSSEIFYDHGEEYTDGSDTSKCILADEGRYVEIWNLVFMQYEKFVNDGEVKRRKLPKPCVDTGGGLERITAAIQGVYWNYDTDIFAPIIQAIEELSGKKYNDPKYTSSIRIVCDHIRSSVMLITDGVMPSNEGRGYVLRRIIRRAVRHLSELGLEDNSFYKLIPAVFHTLGKEYPQNEANTSLAQKLLKLEEEKFRQTLKMGLDLIKKEIKKVKTGNKFSGEIAFKLYDTYGFPLDLTEIILQENNLKLKKNDFDRAMQKQKENSKSASKFTVTKDNLQKYYSIKEKNGASEFLGYTDLNLDAKLIAIEKEGTNSALIFDKTPFYPESGGQTGDQGRIDTQTTSIDILDTQTPVEGLIAHYTKSDITQLKIGQIYSLNVDKPTRELTKKHHSATHLLQSALIKVLGSHVNQAGSRVSSDSLRFDYTHPEAMTKDQLVEVEELINNKIAQGLTVTASVMSKDEATKKGAMALFGEKYGDEVRVLEMGSFSLELCGGTHIQNTNEIGFFTITSESSLSSGIRRIEALVSAKAYEYLNKRSQLLTQIERNLSVRSDEVFSKLEILQSDIKLKNKEIKQLKEKIQAQSSKDLFSKSKTLDNSITFVPVLLKTGSSKELRNISDKFIDQNKEGVLFLYLVENEKVSYILRTHKKNKNINCSNILKSTQTILNGRGGGKPDMAQGSGDANNIPKFLISLENSLGEI